MTAETLREAARVLRERAEAATPGPWGDPTDVHYGDFGWTVYGSPAGETEDSEAGRADAGYIATVHPGVGLALADLLDTAAERVAEIARTLPEGSRQLDGVLLHNVTGYTPALNIARAILGESA